jgi:aerobic-type carbon monoxide dehydrogenase small subunit (CoxS/CutS family)
MTTVGPPTRRVELVVNGAPAAADVEHRATLAELLRDHLGLTGTHLACEHGVCGACTVLVDDVPVRSCLRLAVQCHDQDVTTVEGLGSPGSLHPVQQGFLEELSFQCGFCTPGFVVTAVSWLAERGPDAGVPSDAEVREALSGNLCRCTGYQAIVAGVRRAAALLAQAEPAAAGGGAGGDGGAGSGVAV